MNIQELLDDRAKKYDQKKFLLFEEQEVSYSEFNTNIDRVSAGFKKVGVNKGDMVALMLPNSPEFLYTWLGLNKIGAVAVPINVAHKSDEMAYILGHCGAKCIVLHNNYYPDFEKIENGKLPKLETVICCGETHVPDNAIPFSEFQNEKPDLNRTNISEDDPAVCIYTSGTTGRPKGVLNSHGNWVSTGEAYAYMVGISSDDRVMTPNPLFHANAQVYSTMGSLAAGATLILLERFSASQILEQARRYLATKLILVQAVTPWVWGRPVGDHDGDNPVRTMVAGNVPKEIYKQFEKRFRLKIQTIYSLTEAVFAIMGPREGIRPRKIGSIGVEMEHPNPVIKNEIKIVDDTGIEVPSGKQGEIAIRNPLTMLGYLNDPEKTNETKRDGWVFTGDIGYKDSEGYFFFVGRKKDVIRRRGELISPTEIEDIIRTHPKVDESAVLGIPSGLGTGEEEIKAYVVLKPGEKVTANEIISWCEGKLAKFKIPRFVEFRGTFPKSAIGRIQKNVLKEEKEDLTQDCFDRLNP